MNENDDLNLEEPEENQLNLPGLQTVNTSNNSNSGIKKRDKFLKYFIEKDPLSFQDEMIKY